MVRKLALEAAVFAGCSGGGGESGGDAARSADTDGSLPLAECKVLPATINPSNGTILADLSLSNAKLDQIFQRAQTRYTATVNVLTSTTEVLVTPADPEAQVTVNCSELGQTNGHVSIKPGVNMIAITVKAADGVDTSTYTVAITRRTLDSFSLQAYIKTPTPRLGFRRSFDLDGDELASASNGAIYLFVRQSGVWTLETTIPGPFGGIGNSVSLDSGTVAIGHEWGNEAYVFIRDPAGGWTQQAHIRSPNADQHDRFGSKLALSGDILAISASSEDSASAGIDGDMTDNSAEDSGAVYVYRREAGEWLLEAYIKASDADPGDRFGDAIALDNTTLAVGAWTKDVNQGHPDGSGGAYVFVRAPDGTWTEQSVIKPKNRYGIQQFNIVSEFGRSIDLSGDTLAVGANAVGRIATGINPPPSRQSICFCGAAYVFARDPHGLWTQQAEIRASNTDAHDHFGDAVAVDGDTLAVTAGRESSGATGIQANQSSNSAPLSGALYLFRRDAAGQWSQLAYVKAPNAEAGDLFGYDDAVAIDGDTVAVGASEEASFATTVDGDQADNGAPHSGAIYVYQ